MKNELKQTKSNFFYRKNLKQMPSQFQCYVVRKLGKLINYLNDCYLINILSYTQNAQNTGKPNKLLSVITVCRHDFHNGLMAYMSKFP